MKNNVRLVLKNSQFCILNSAFCIFLSAFLIFNSAFSFGQQAPGIQWQNTIGGNGADKIFYTHQTTDGGYICGGNSLSNISGDKTQNCYGNWDYWIIKLDSVGNVVWDKTIGGNADDQLLDMQQTSDGGYICGGVSQSNISGDKTENSFGYSDYWIVKLDSTGNIQWDNTIGGFGQDNLYSIEQTFDGGYICAGMSESSISGDKTEGNIGAEDYWVIKLNSAGNIIWQNTIGGTDDDKRVFIRQLSDGSFMVGGASFSNISGDKTEMSKGLSDLWLVKLDTAGIVVWDKTIGGNSYDEIFDMQKTNDKGFIIGIASQSDISGDKTENNCMNTPINIDYWILKLDSSANIEWENTIGGNDNDRIGSVQETADGGFIIGGTSASNISCDKSEDRKGFDDYWIIKLNAAGAIQWQSTIGGSGLEVFPTIQQTADMGYICGGTSPSGISYDKTEASVGSTDYWIVKLYPDTTTGISNVVFENCDLKVFPNPAKDEITISFSPPLRGGWVGLKIYDVMGNEVFSQSSINRTSQIVNLKSFSHGVYFVQLQTGAKVSRMKFVKQ